MTNIFIKPARPDLIVRDPVTGVPLKAEGEYKPRSSYWIRRKNEGDVIETTPKQTATEEKG